MMNSEGHGPTHAVSCEQYEKLLAELELRDLTENEVLECIAHEDLCCAGRHTPAGLEQELGLPQGAFQHGAPEFGLRSAAENRRRIMALLQNHKHSPQLSLSKLPTPDSIQLRNADSTELEKASRPRSTYLDSRFTAGGVPSKPKTALHSAARASKWSRVFRYIPVMCVAVAAAATTISLFWTPTRAPLVHNVSTRSQPIAPRLLEPGTEIRPLKHAPDSLSSDASIRAIDLEETEINLRYKLFLTTADLGGDFTIDRTAGTLVMSGIPRNAEFAAKWTAAVDAVPGVRLEIVHELNTSSGDGSNTSDSSEHSPQQPPLLVDAFNHTPESEVLQSTLLQASNEVVAHAFAIRKLEQAYSDNEIRSLSTDGRDKLRDILGGHLRMLVQENYKIDPLANRIEDATVAPNQSDVREVTSPDTLLEEANRQKRLVIELAINRLSVTLATAKAEFPSVHRDLRNQANDLLASRDLLESIYRRR